MLNRDDFAANGSGCGPISLRAALLKRKITANILESRGMSLNAIRAAGRPKLDVDTILSHWLSFAVLLTIIAIYYLFLLSNGTFQLFGLEMLDKAFDNMLVHLLRGEFTVDREAIGYEAFTRDGKNYGYFGIFPAVHNMLTGIPGGLLWLVPRPIHVPVAHSETAQAPVSIP